jgi:FkbM family methyltransferase
MRSLTRVLLRAWGRTRIAPGHLYQAVELWGRHLADKPVFCHLFNGCEVYCDLHEHIQRQIYFFGAYEPIEAYLFHRLLEPGMCVIDAGANIGQYTLIAAQKVGSEGQVHAFEPIPHNYKTLDLHLRINNLDRRVQANACALWDSSRNITLNLAAGDLSDNATNFSISDHGDIVETFECRAVRLDDYARGQGLGSVDLIKMDIEGAELFALRGGRELLESSRPTILLEINRAHSQALGYEPEAIWDLLKSYGYTSLHTIGHTPETSSRLESLVDVDRANVLFSARELPDTFWRGWSFQQIVSDFRSLAYAGEV